MYYLVTMDYNGVASHQKQVGRVLRSALYPVHWMGQTMICCGITVMRMGMLGVSVMKMKALAVKMETVTLIGEGR
jgi:hypothetical protein